MSAIRYTLEEIEAMPGNSLKCKHVAGCIGCSEQGIRSASQTAEGRAALGFPCVRTGSHVFFPKIPFLKFMRGEVQPINYITPNPRSILPPYGFGHPAGEEDPGLQQLLVQLGKPDGGGKR